MRKYSSKIFILLLIPLLPPTEAHEVERYDRRFLIGINESFSFTTGPSQMPFPSLFQPLLSSLAFLTLLPRRGVPRKFTSKMRLDYWTPLKTAGF